MALRDLQHVVGLGGPEASGLSPEAVRLRQQGLAMDTVSRLKLLANGSNCPVRVTDYEIAEHRDGEFIILYFEAATPGKPIDSLDLDCAAFFQLDPQMRGLLRVEHQGVLQTAVFNADQPKARFVWAAPDSRGKQFRSFLEEGAWHIWKGYDHILFLLALLLPAVLRREEGAWSGVPAFRPALFQVLKIVTSFTVAHSITLALATLKLVSLPSRGVESVIALSVLLAALNNVFPVFRGRTWLLVFAFGLIHGFGFANVLAELGLEKGTLALTLVGFNLGVELGQLAVVGLFLPLAYGFRHTLGYQRWALRGGSALVALVAATWMLERLFDFKVLPF